MASGSFMEKILKGNLDRAVFDSFHEPLDSDKVQSLLQAYREIFKDHSLQKIEEDGRIPDELLLEMRRKGFFGITVAEDYGGLGIDLVNCVRLVEEISALDVATAIVFLAHLFIGIKGIEMFGTEDQKRRYLPLAASGEMIFSYALTEPNFGSDARHIETKAELSGDGKYYILNGTKTYITNANYSRGLTVFAQMDPAHPGSMGAFIVEMAWEGVKVGKDMPKMGIKASSTATVQFHNVHVPVENLLGKPGEGYKIALAVLNYGRLALGAVSAGLIDVSIKDMLKRAGSRIQFGVPIRNFPLVQEKIINARVHGFVCSCMNYFTANLLEPAPTEDPVIETSHCKLFGSTRAWDVLYDALQVAGGSGYLSTQPYEKRMRDFRVVPIFEGTTEIHSVYPALFLLGRLRKQIRSHHGFSRWIFILNEFLSSFEGMPWRLDAGEKVVSKAVALVKANIRTIKRLLLLGMIFYGEKVGEREFFLRRVTTLSLYIFGILSVLAKISKDQKAGIRSSSDLKLLRYFLKEAKEARCGSRRMFDTRKEKLGSSLFHDIEANFKS
ncbi:MAG TPA: acyl-CoA dehydrogenase family protein [Syntrophales bacterium]|nr:acyl-CoA dehydrogenase family protein [Syntrophales bacterium]